MKFTINHKEECPSILYSIQIFGLIHIGSPQNYGQRPKPLAFLAQYLFHIEKGNFLTKLTSALGGAETGRVKADHPIYGLLAIWQNAFIWLQ